MSGTDVLFDYHQGFLLRDAGRSLAMVEPSHQADCWVARPCPHGCAYGVGLTLNKKKVVAWCREDCSSCSCVVSVAYHLYW